MVETKDGVFMRSPSSSIRTTPLLFHYELKVPFRLPIPTEERQVFESRGVDTPKGIEKGSVGKFYPVFSFSQFADDGSAYILSLYIVIR